ncbi:uncharacterized protein LOC129172622 isoform X2 [Dunckerocampus dactyliophorus]|uniref:uncharacterized protein LOC129172622 isoform X2 n=1 Tax=Dunckerocampus dactyliophorus TaxID=161453 RepID=UPI00240696DE|nr:uncharacterized protein LOC129172622 isoform X2 [Dunckerocampus dactyliophorus]
MLPNSWNEIMIVLLYFTAARGDPQVVMVKDGDDATLPCEHLLDSQVSCGLTWLFSNDSNTYELITSGRIGSGFTSRARRLSLTANCSLVIKGVAAQDAGPYFCRMYQGGREKDSVIYLYVVTLTVKSISEDGRMASCIVHSPGRCQHQVMWLLAGTRVNSQHSHVKTSRPSKCNTTASFTSSYSIYSTKELLQCQVEYSSTKLVLDLPSTGDRQQERSLPKTDNTNTESTGEPPQHNSDKGWFVIVSCEALTSARFVYVLLLLPFSRQVVAVCGGRRGFVGTFSVTICCGDADQAQEKQRLEHLHLTHIRPGVSRGGPWHFPQIQSNKTKLGHPCMRQTWLPEANSLVCCLFSEQDRHRLEACGDVSERGQR